MYSTRTLATESSISLFLLGTNEHVIVPFAFRRHLSASGRHHRHYHGGTTSSPHCCFTRAGHTSSRYCWSSHCSCEWCPRVPSLLLEAADGNRRRTIQSVVIVIVGQQHPTSTRVCFETHDGSTNNPPSTVAVQESLSIFLASWHGHMASQYRRH